jgi:hypothetical protein
LSMISNIIQLPTINLGCKEVGHENGGSHVLARCVGRMCH